MKTQHFRFTFREERHGGDTIMKTNRPSSRGRRLLSGLFIHNLTLTHTKRPRQGCRLARSIVLLVRCAFVALVGVTVLSGISQTATFTAVAATTNTAPVFTEGASTTRSVAENTVSSVNIGATVSATDANNDTLTYTLSGADAAAFNIVPTTGQLKTKSALDYETKPTYTVSVSVSDGSLTDTITVTINVRDIADDEQPGGTTYASGEEIPTLPTGFWIPDLTAGGAAFSFSGGKATIEFNNGGKIVEEGITYTCVSNGGCKIENTRVTKGIIQVTGAESEETPGTTNTAPVFTEGASTTRSVAENTPANVNIGTSVAATDAENDTLTYTFSGTDAASFNIERTTGQLKTKAILDSETKRSYTVTVTVTDGSLTDTITVTISVTDLEDTPVVSTLTPVSDRTPQVRDAIVAAVPGVSSSSDVTEAHLATITTLDLSNKNISALKVGDFDGLSSLKTLFLDDNQLTTLPEDIFDGLTALTTLLLWGNQLSTLPEDIFDELITLTTLRLGYNRFTTLPSTIFDSLTKLTTLLLWGNQFTTLPEGIFEGLTGLTTLRLNNNAVDPLPLTVSLQKVADGQFKAVAPTGAPFEFVLPLTVENGAINGDITTITIPKGSIESAPLAVTRTPDPNTVVTVNISTLPGLPSNHYGYTLAKSDALPLEVIGARTPDTVQAETTVNIPDVNLRAKIETALGKTSGATITATEMATLTSLNAQNAGITNLMGLETAINLTELWLWDNKISDISAVAGLTKLTTLYIWGNTISDISAVAGLTNLTHLRLGENSVSNISAVAGLTNLTHLVLKENSISDISSVAKLTNLTELQIGGNAISDISPVANLTNLVWLDVPNNSISNISAVMRLTKLIEVSLGENSISDISPLVANTGLGENTEIYIQGNPLSYSSIYTHIPALQARDVWVDFDNRTPTAPVKISGDTQQGTPGTALANPFVVEVRGGSGVAFAEVPVVFAVTAGGGTLSATNTTTDANGRAESTLTLGNSAGTNTVRVSVQGISQTATFTAVAATTKYRTGVHRGCQHHPLCGGKYGVQCKYRCYSIRYGCEQRHAHLYPQWRGCCRL